MPRIPSIGCRKFGTAPEPCILVHTLPSYGSRIGLALSESLGRPSEGTTAAHTSILYKPSTTSTWGASDAPRRLHFEFRYHNSERRTPDLHDADRIAHPQVSAPERTSVTATGIQVAGRVTLRHLASIRGQDRRVGCWLECAVASCWLF
jgi:hypothetical protein